jgi:hypothetical protein
MGGIFISYRREDASGHTGRLRDHLQTRFGSLVFQDVYNIPDGENFDNVLSKALEACDVALIVIGRRWLSATDSQGRRRLDDPNDWVRVETRQLLQRNIRVIPVLVGGATMPQSHELPADVEGLAKRQAREVRDTAWEADVRALVQRLSQIVHVDDPHTKGRAVDMLGVAIVWAGVLGMQLLTVKDVGTESASEFMRASWAAVGGLLTGLVVLRPGNVPAWIRVGGLALTWGAAQYILYHWQAGSYLPAMLDGISPTTRGEAVKRAAIAAIACAGSTIVLGKSTDVRVWRGIFVPVLAWLFAGAVTGYWSTLTPAPGETLFGGVIAGAIAGYALGWWLSSTLESADRVS